MYSNAWKISVNVGAISEDISFSRYDGIWSGPVAFVYKVASWLVHDLVNSRSPIATYRKLL